MLAFDGYYYDHDAAQAVLDYVASLEGVTNARVATTDDGAYVVIYHTTKVHIPEHTHTSRPNG